MTPPYVEELARAVLTLAEDGGMPDSFWATDSRIDLAKHILFQDNRLTRAEVCERLGL